MARSSSKAPQRSSLARRKTITRRPCSPRSRGGTCISLPLGDAKAPLHWRRNGFRLPGTIQNRRSLTQMDFSLTHEQQQIRDAILKLCEGFGDEYWLDHDRSGEFPE